MTTQDPKGTALIERKPNRLARVEELTTGNIKTQQQLGDRMRELQEQVFLISPGSGGGAGMIAPGYEITPVLVVIDPSVDAESGRGADVYHQRSIHKGTGRGSDYRPQEVSLNHNGLMRILGAVGVNVATTRWINDGARERNLWVCETDGDLIDFTGTLRKLPTGIGSLDARDGSADIGEWTPEEWANRVSDAEQQRARVPKEEQWKVKPEPLPGGWTKDRVLQVRKYGRQLTKTKSLNGLARKLGVRQTYTIEELRQKPFVILRPVFMPDMTDPYVRRMVTAAHLGARELLYPGMTGADAPVTHAPGEAGQTLAAMAVIHDRDEQSEPEAPERMQTAAPPEDAEELSFDEPKPAPTAEPTFIITKIRRKGTGPDQQFFIETKEGVTLFTTDEAIMQACRKAGKDGLPREIPTERIVVAGQPYRQILEIMAPGGLKL